MVTPSSAKHSRMPWQTQDPPSVALVAVLGWRLTGLTQLGHGQSSLRGQNRQMGWDLEVPSMGGMGTVGRPQKHLALL